MCDENSRYVVNDHPQFSVLDAVVGKSDKRECPAKWIGQKDV